MAWELREVLWGDTCRIEVWVNELDDVLYKGYNIFTEELILARYGERKYSDTISKYM